MSELDQAVLNKIVEAIRDAAFGLLQRHAFGIMTHAGPGFEARLRLISGELARNCAAAVPAFVNPVLEEMERQGAEEYQQAHLRLDRAGVPRSGGVPCAGSVEHKRFSLGERISWLAQQRPAIVHAAGCPHAKTIEEHTLAPINITPEVKS